jgi:hypothetical protein
VRSGDAYGRDVIDVPKRRCASCTTLFRPSTSIQRFCPQADCWPSEFRETIELYGSGLDFAEIRDHHGTPKATTSYRLAVCGVKSRRPRINKQDSDRIVLSYARTRSLRATAQAEGRSRSAVRSTLLAAGIELQERGGVKGPRLHRFNQRAFAVLTDEVAYWVGFCVADLTVRKHLNAIKLELEECDAVHIAKFLAFIGSETHQIKYDRKRGSAYVSISGAGEMVADLAKYGVIPNKTFATEAPAVLAGNPAFWRGVVDGDGEVGFLHTERSRRGQARLRVTGTRRLMEQLSEFIESELGSRPRIEDHHGGSPLIATLVTEGDTARDAVRLLYSDRDVPTLNRKRVLADAMMRHDTRAVAP